MCNVGCAMCNVTAELLAASALPQWSLWAYWAWCSLSWAGTCWPPWLPHAPASGLSGGSGEAEDAYRFTAVTEGPLLVALG